MDADLPQPEPEWRRADLPYTQRRLEDLDEWYLRFAGQLNRVECPSDDELFQLLFVVAEAIVANDCAAIAAAFDAVKSLRGLPDPDTGLGDWCERLYSVQLLIWLAHFCLVDEPL